MSVAAKIAAIPAAFVLMAVSLPWIAWSIGCFMVGDEAGADRTFEASPFYRYLDWIEAHRVA